MKTIAQQLNIKQFPFEIRNEQGNLIYKEEADGFWARREYTSDGWLVVYYEDSGKNWIKRDYDSKGKKQIYYEDSSGLVEDNRP